MEGGQGGDVEECCHNMFTLLLPEERSYNQLSCIGWGSILCVFTRTRERSGRNTTYRGRDTSSPGLKPRWEPFCA